MRILQLIPSLQNGGAERFVCELSNELQSRADVACDIALMYDVTAYPNGFVSSLKGVNIYSLRKNTGFSLRYLIQLYLFIKKNHYDVVHAHLNTITYLILSAFLLPKVKFIATIHSDASFEAPGKLDKCVRKILFKFKRVVPITISEESNKSFVDYYNETASVVYNGLSPFNLQNTNDELIRKSKDDVIFVHPASCQPVKNQKLLLSAFNRIVKKYNNVFLYWFGSNEQNKVLFNKLAPFLNDRIRYCGCVNNIRDYLYQADAMCLASLVEGMPMVIIEAFSVGCIPIVTPAGGCVNMVRNGYNGLISKTFEEDEYYEMLDRFINLTSDEKDAIKNNCILSFQKYSIERSADLYMEVYKA